MTKRTVPFLVCLLFWLLLYLPLESQDKDEAFVQKLKNLGEKCLKFAERNDGKMPDSLSELYYRAYIHDLEDFVCPENPTEILHQTEIDTKSGYVLSPEASGSGVRPIVQDRSSENHGGRGIYIYYSDGTVQWQAAPSGGRGLPIIASSPVPVWAVAGLAALLLASAALLVSVLVLRRRETKGSLKIRARIEVVYRDGGRKSFEIRDQRTSIGRAPENALVINDANVSVAHAEIFIAEGMFYIRDLGSSNGTYLNRNKISESPLYLGDEIILGETKLIFGN
jgi:hypothetical protein